MRALRLAVVLPLVMAIGCTTEPADQATADKAAAPTEDVATVRQAIEAANANQANGFKAGNIDGIVANYTPDAMVMMTGQASMVGAAAIREGLTGWLSQGPITDFVLTTGDVMLADDLAIETGTFTLTQKPKDGAAMTDKGKYISVWKKQADGSWKIVRDIANSDIPMGH
jgi:uncharacterized protein (TIGR02246 family)